MGERRLADAALTRHDRDDGADGGETRPEPPLLGLDLSDDVRAAVPRDVLVLLHAPPSEDHAARASIAAVTAATSAISPAAARRRGTPPPQGGLRIDSAPASARRATKSARTATRAARTRSRAGRE